MQPPKQRKPWQLKARDFGTKKVHAEQDWRFQMFFEYLRISPSYALATSCENEAQLAQMLGNNEQAAAIWKTRCDVGDVFSVLYREWWLRTGMGLFGIKSARPRVEAVSRMPASLLLEDCQEASGSELAQFIQTRFTDQGKPDSLLVSIPVGLKRVTIMKQLRLLLDALEPAPPSVRNSEYALEKNKMRQSRLMAGLRLAYMRAARPKDELWRASTRAKISATHRGLDPLADKKDAKSAEARRMLTIMSSRLIHDALVLAENAACGVFPSLQPVPTIPFDFPELGKRLKQVSRWEKAEKERLLAKARKSNVKQIDVA